MQELEYKQAFVLHSRPFKENQAIVEMLVEGEGRISVVANKGSKKNSARSALLQPFRALRIQYKPGKGLHSLKSIEANVQHEEIKLVSKALFCGFYLNEIVCRLCKSDAYYDELYPLYLYALSHLNNAGQLHDELAFKQYIEIILRQFESRLLTLLGYGVSFEHNIELDQPIEPSLYYELFNDVGFVMTNIAQRGFIGSDLLSIEQLLHSDINLAQIDAKHLKQSKHILRACLHRHLGDKPLKSRELFRK